MARAATPTRHPRRNRVAPGDSARPGRCHCSAIYNPRARAALFLLGSRSAAQLRYHFSRRTSSSLARLWLVLPSAELTAILRFGVQRLFPVELRRRSMGESYTHSRPDL